VICTEKEAGTKWCPQSRTSEGGYTRCIGSACMMWIWTDGEQAGRWVRMADVADAVKDGWFIDPAGVGEMDGEVDMVREIQPGERRGTCGLIRGEA